MDFLSLPTEVILEVLAAAVIARGLKRALRLRLVCKTFSSLFKEALFATDLLDSYACEAAKHEDCIPRAYEPGYCELLQQYISFSIWSPLKEQTPNSALIRGTAEAYCCLAGTSDEGSIRKCIEVLADIRLHRYREDYFAHQSPYPQDDNNHKMNILVASTCMNNVSVTRQVLSTLELSQHTKTIRCDFSHSADNRVEMGMPMQTLFTCPMTVATLLGRREILEVFFTRSPKPFTWCTIPTLGRYGSIDTFEFLLQRFKRVHIEIHLTSSGGWFGENPDPGVFERTHKLSLELPRESLLPSGKEYMKRPWRWGIPIAARNGSVELLRHLLDQGAPVNPEEPTCEPFGLPFGEPGILRCAARNGQHDAVRLLLERGADINHKAHKAALPASAAAGSLETVRLLLEYGADVNQTVSNPGDFPPAVVSAVRLEHVAMFNLLVERGGLSDDVWQLAMREAKEHELESMVELLNNSRDSIVESRPERLDDLPEVRW